MGRPGYNRRPLALRDAARRIVAEHGGDVPADPTALEALPGVGAYTARAVAAAAFGMAVAPVDVNVRRVIGRLSRLDRTADIQAEADRLISRDHPAVWVQAVMDLAVAVCVRRDPRCDQCPVAVMCASRGTTGDPPRARRRAGDRKAEKPGFETTNRWLRGRILRLVRESVGGEWVAFDGPAGVHDFAAVRAALTELEREGFLERDGDRARLAAG